MLRYPIKFIIGFVVLVTFLLLGSFYFWGDGIDTFLSGAYEKNGHVAIRWLSHSARIINGLPDLIGTEEKLSHLESENADLESKLARLSSVENENAFLREALKIPSITKLNPVIAGVFSAINAPDGHFLLLNRGSKDSIRVDDGVISEKGVLIGKIDQVFENHARAMIVTDIGFKTTVLAQESNVSGIAQGVLHSGIIIDFIAENEEIKEGDMIITAGNDFLPAGLIIGEVQTVEQETGSLFKKVTVSPSLWKFVPAKVLVIRK